MNLQSTPLSNRCHIGFFGTMNAGKSSLINAFLGQNLSVVSEKKGTTTDPVKKTMELLPYGPIVVFDTAGFDDKSEIGNFRIEKTKEIIDKIDIAILVVDATIGLSDKDKELINLFKNTPYIIVNNKCDLLNIFQYKINGKAYVSAKNNLNINELKEEVGKLVLKHFEKEKLIIADKLKKDDIVILVIPIDEAAPKGRLILPQQLVLRELLDNNIVSICLQTDELKNVLNKITPNLVITDSQAFNKVKEIVPDNIKLTSFSILFANYKGDLKSLIEGIKVIKNLKNGDNILISEGCTHHRQCNDIGSVKIPSWLKSHTKKELNFSFSSGNDFPKNLENYDLIIHCGGCMLNEKEMKSRIKTANNQNIPIINYGILISYMNGILNRSLEIFPEIVEFLGE